MHLVEDQYQRTFKTLRISLTNVCNLGCVYCVQGEELRKENTLLSIDQLLHIISELKEVLLLDTIRLTGGEPTLYKELIPLIQGLNNLGLTNVKMTSNGYLLGGMVASLAAAGLKEVNISLDAIDADVFFKVTRRKDLNRVLHAIEQCIEHGIRVKLNAVIMKGMNDSQILPLLDYATKHKVAVRYLELMKMGYYYSHEFENFFYSEKNILATIAKKYAYVKEERIAGATANYWITEKGNRFGIIANESNPFCGDCDRLRLDSSGNVLGCLSENTAVPLYDVLGDQKELIKRLQLALSHKQAVRFKGSKLEMIAIGG